MPKITNPNVGKANKKVQAIKETQKPAAEAAKEAAKEEKKSPYKMLLILAVVAVGAYYFLRKK